MHRSNYLLSKTKKWLICAMMVLLSLQFLKTPCLMINCAGDIISSTIRAYDLVPSIANCSLQTITQKINRKNQPKNFNHDLIQALQISLKQKHDFITKKFKKISENIKIIFNLLNLTSLKFSAFQTFFDGFLTALALSYLLYFYFIAHLLRNIIDFAYHFWRKIYTFLQTIYISFLTQTKAILYWQLHTSTVW